MEFLALYSPARTCANPGRQAELEVLTARLFDAGVLVACGEIQSCGFGTRTNERDFEGLPRDSGYAVFRVQSQEQLWQHSMDFLNIASDGVSELIRIDLPNNETAAPP